jgi:hypothetical protein
VEMKAMDDPHHSAAVLPVSSVSSSPATSVMYEDSVESSFELSPDQAVCVREMVSWSGKKRAVESVY